MLSFIIISLLLSTVFLLYYVTKNDIKINLMPKKNETQALSEVEVKLDTFLVEFAHTVVGSFSSYSEAVNFSKGYPDSSVHFKKLGHVIWKQHDKLPSSVLFDVPFIQQLPELPRGCEVTSLAMLLHYDGINVDKMDLAKQIKRDETPFKKENGVTQFGNPYNGFVGDMYSFSTPGYGVYHGPIVELAREYKNDKVIDLTGFEFSHLLYHLANGRPVWVIINATYRPLPETAFETWKTPDGSVKITYREHSVVITGFDHESIYINDPLAKEKNKKVNRKEFEQAWNQMGQQALTIIRDN